MTPMFRKRYGLGFLDESSNQPPLVSSKGKEIVFVKAGFNTCSEPEIEENTDIVKNEPLKGLTDLQSSQSKITSLELELNKLKKCNDLLMGKFMKSENDYLRIEKDLKRSNLKVQFLEQDLEKSVS